jgi:hypothetical protein
VLKVDFPNGALEKITVSCLRLIPRLKPLGRQATPKEPLAGLLVGVRARPWSKEVAAPLRDIPPLLE